MNITCIICSDILQANSTALIYSTSCGHVFHYTCLLQWLERSKTCPQCRDKATERTIHRVFFNYANTDCIVDDVGTLQAKMDTMQFQITLKDKDIRNYSEKYHKFKEQSVSLREMVRNLETKQATYESVIHALKEQISYFKSKGKDAEKLTDEIKRLKDRMRNYEDVQLVISGTKDQVKDMLRYNKDPESLNLLICTLKKELVESERKNKHQTMNMKHLQNDMSGLRREIADLTKTNAELRNDIECHKNCEQEKQYLKRKLEQQQEKLSNWPSCGGSPDTSVRRLIAESPAPFKSSSLQQWDTVDLTDTSPLAEKAQTKTDSPYLTIKSSSVGLSCLMSPKFTNEVRVPTAKRNAGEYNIFKNPLAKFDNVKQPKADYNYDGMGGHSKEIIFPNPIAGVKRSRPGSISTSKFRKLAPNKKLHEFFNTTDDK